MAGFLIRREGRRCGGGGESAAFREFPEMEKRREATVHQLSKGILRPCGLNQVRAEEGVPQSS